MTEIWQVCYFDQASHYGISALQNAKQSEKDSNYPNEVLDVSICRRMHARGIFSTPCQPPKLTNIKESKYNNHLQEIGNAEILDITYQVPC